MIKLELTTIESMWVSKALEFKKQDIINRRAKTKGGNVIEHQTELINFIDSLLAKVNAADWEAQKEADLKLAADLIAKHNKNA